MTLDTSVTEELKWGGAKQNEYIEGKISFRKDVRENQCFKDGEKNPNVYKGKWKNIEKDGKLQGKQCLCYYNTKRKPFLN